MTYEERKALVGPPLPRLFASLVIGVVLANIGWRMLELWCAS
jgi:hypothetical protein